MDITIKPGKLHGTVQAMPSKSQMHRLLICAAFADRTTEISCADTNQDMEATANCLQALGADIVHTDSHYIVTPIKNVPDTAILDCRESGSTLRFLLPIVGALGVDATFFLSGRLPERPLAPLWKEMARMGCTLSRPTDNTIRCSGRLYSGAYCIDSSVSSQFITGLLFALTLMDGNSTLTVCADTVSKPYITLTKQTMGLFGVKADIGKIIGVQRFLSPGQVTVEGDWSSAAFFLAANGLGSNVQMEGLDANSVQGDRIIIRLLCALEKRAVIDVCDIPDLLPILAVAAGAKKGATFTGIDRLRYKESDRVSSVTALLRSLGATTEVADDTMVVHPHKYQSCTVDSCNDHRIAMAAAIAATVAGGPVTIHNAQCVEKSYPSFWRVFKELGGNYEQHIR